MTRWPIEVKEHARRRARERFPEMKVARIHDEVRAALHHGRVSACRPPWLAEPKDPMHGVSLYTWTEDQVRTHIVHALDDRFVVMSVLGVKR